MTAKFIVESRRPGEQVVYVTKREGRGTDYTLIGWREAAHKFDSKSLAQVAARRFSSAYALTVTEVKDGRENADTRPRQR